MPTLAAKGWHSGALPWDMAPSHPHTLNVPSGTQCWSPSPAGTPVPPVLERHMEKLLGSPNHASSSRVSAQDCGFWAGVAVGADPSVLPLPEKRVPLRILYEEYRDKLTQDNLIKVVALLNDHQTGDILVAVRDIYVENPKIKIRVRVQCPIPGRFEGNELL